VGDSGQATDVLDGEMARPTAISEGRAIRALVTRPREEATAHDLSGVQALLCTSANGVRALARITTERELPLLAVGDATASRARAEGFTDVASAAGSLADLVGLAMMRLRPQRGTLVHVSGEAVAGDLGGALRARGFTVERNVLYDTRPVAALSRPAIRALCSDMIDFALFFSPRTAAIFVRLANSADVAACCQRITALSISEATDTALSALSWRDRQFAQKPSQPALLDRLDRVLGARQHV
jgi:uroporphyrinogen-III synthase